MIHAPFSLKAELDLSAPRVAASDVTPEKSAIEVN
jgi:hypothetical protein